MKKLNGFIYRIIDNDLMYDRSVDRCPLGIARAKARVTELENLGFEAFYSIGTLPKVEAYY